MNMENLTYDAVEFLREILVVNPFDCRFQATPVCLKEIRIRHGFEIR